MMIIDTDSHIIEAPDVWTARMSKQKWGDSIPHVKWDESTKMEAWFIGERRFANAWSAAWVGWEKPFPSAPPRRENVYPPALDAAERVKVMDQTQIRAAVLYPNLAFVGYNIHKALADPAYQLDVLRAYNDWLMDWIAVAPERFVPLALTPYWDVDAAVAEVGRAARKGYRGVVFPAAPHMQGHPFLGDRHWDPFWSAVQEAGMSINFHAGDGDMSAYIGPERLALEGPALMVARAQPAGFLYTAIQLTDLLFSGVLPRYPKLKFVFAECGIGWVPFVLEAADHHFLRNKVRSEHPEFELMPSDYYRRQVYSNYWFEQLEDWHIEKVGLQSILFETDFPHPTCLHGSQVQEAVETRLGKVDQKARDAILWKNAAELYGIEV
jgi:predicted TIM-barrel fold metal-dependent hydrolase